jgi:hypothetical protein
LARLQAGYDDPVPGRATSSDQEGPCSGDQSRLLNAAAARRPFTGALKGNEARPPWLRLGGAGADEFAELENYRVGDEIVDAYAGAAAPQNVRGEQCLQMPRDVGLIRSESRDDFSHGSFSRFERLQNPEPLGLTERFETAGGKVHQWAR